MKRRFTGRVNANRKMYEVVSPDGDVVKEIPLDEAADHSKLQAAIGRNGWDEVNG